MNHKNPESPFKQKVVMERQQMLLPDGIRSITFLLLLLSAFACQNTPVVTTGLGDSTAESQTNSPDSSQILQRLSSLSGCYQMTIKDDTALMQITVQDSNITGTLVYLFREKDKNKGELSGAVRGEYIYADYRFYSEGTTSTREVVFKIKDRALVPGFGDIIQRDSKIVFTNKDSLQFQYETPFLKLPCPGLSSGS